MFLFIVSTIFLAAAAFLQTTNVPLIGLVKPNLVFAILVVFAHVYKDWPRRSILILLSALILKFSPSLAWADIIFIATAFLIMALVDYLPWRRLINSIAAVIIGTVIIDALPFALTPLVIGVGMNIILAALFFLLVELVYAEEIQKQKSRF